ncbi:hypothetical protein HAP94_19410 [Acidithiobacillus ferrivorans]|nr:hypothetical protein [Acidithiobacillus ferrivorans]
MEMTDEEAQAIIEEGHMEMAYEQLAAMAPADREKLLNSVEFADDGEPEGGVEYIDYTDCPKTRAEAEAMGYQIGD